MSNYKKSHILRTRLAYTLIMLVVFILIRMVPLVGVDYTAYELITSGNVNGLLEFAIAGNTQKLTLMSLGFTSFFIASILIQVFVSCCTDKFKSNLSSISLKYVTMGIAIAFATIQAVYKVSSFSYAAGCDVLLYRIVNVLQLVAGMSLMIWFGDKIKENGIGGMSAIIVVNIVTGIVTTIKRNIDKSWQLATVLCMAALIITLVMELKEKHIPVQRISIHNVHTEKNYIAIKYNPVGMTPVMFSTAFFAVVQYAVKLLADEPFNIEPLKAISDDIVLTGPLGVVIYIVIVYILTILFAFLFISPKDITEQFLKTGDCLVGIRTGGQTRFYLSMTVFFMALVGASVTAICIAVPMYLQVKGLLDEEFMMMPISVMMLVGIVSRIVQEMKVYINYDRYEPFV